MLADVDDTCQVYCGAHATMQGRFASHTRVRPTVSCDDSQTPLPDFDALEEAAKRLLERR